MLIRIITFIEECSVEIEKNIDENIAKRISYQIWYKRCLKGKFGRGVQICEGGGPYPLWHRDDVSSYLKYYQLSSEILDYKLILFRSGHFDHDIMEKIQQLLVCSKHPNTLRNIGNAVKVLVNSHSTRENVKQ